ncbi:MFS transporter [Streptomyces sp. BG9H]|uniref:MFS transporter n=1 Tax=Streptomyces anatolicus TaxID=2675858 RepID=A0ABS6YU81_9ACTN|nr:MFS transporter [Streptomyces anatolicus]MBW5424107.1 MFS transporter [Streptomyces anatolicus]
MALSARQDQIPPPDRPAGTPRGLMPLLLVGNTAMFTLYIGVGGVLLPLQIERIDEADKVAMLGLVSGVSAVFATLFNPVAGALSDRSGRRNPWILGSGLAAVGAMALLGGVDTVLLVTIAWCVGQAVVNVFQAALTSVVPDRVPLSARGKASAAVGLGMPLGSTIGALLGSAFADHIRTGYLVLGAFVALAAVLFTSFAREKPPTTTDRAEKAPLKRQFAAFLGALRHHDFRWAFIGRALLVLGYFCVFGYQLYILQDHIALPSGISPEGAVAILTPVNAVAMALSTVVGGVLSDRLNRRKLFVALSAVISAVALIVPAVSPTWPAMIVFAVLNGLGFGCFMAVDNALVSMILPSAEDAARDLGVLNMAQAGPQILAPFAASVIVSLCGGGQGGGYTALFIAGAVLSLLGALAVRPIRGVR